MSCRIVLVLFAVVVICRTAAAGLTFACGERNDLYQSVVKGGSKPARYDTPGEAVERAAAGSGVMLLADGYPTARVGVDDAIIERARAKQLRLYVEFPQAFAGVTFDDPRDAVWERVVVVDDSLPQPFSKHRILAAHGCTFLPVNRGQATGAPLLVLARVAGYNSAVYGLPPRPFPLLFKTRDGHLVATTKLSGFVTGRYAPAVEWAALWRHILRTLDPESGEPRLVTEPSVRPAYSREEALPPDAEAQALGRYASWIRTAGLLVAPARRESFHDLLRRGVEITDPPALNEPAGDGSLGLLEGYASRVHRDGSQPRRLPLRADCHGESAMVLALHGLLTGDAASRAVATNLLDFVYFNSGMHRGVFGDANHPAFGLIAWGDVAPAWTVATYGDDNARALLATIVAAACLGSDRWDASVLKGLLANLRTTGRLGFRGDRIDVPALERNGWKHYHDADTVNPAMNFEAYPWAGFLWAYQHTGERAFLDRAKSGITMTMDRYPHGWRWADNSERARILLPLAWLVRVEDTPQHRGWLKTIATDLLKNQHATGAIREHLGGAGKGAGHYVVPASNEAYGTTETPLIQQNGDPVSDQLYTAGFALIGLHEAAAATGDPKLKQAADRLADYLVRIQSRSSAVPYLDGSWFRAFDYEKWECWASSADNGWGAWCVEAGWAPAWAAAALGLRARNTSLWELTARSRIDGQMADVQRQMAVNDGGRLTRR